MRINNPQNELNLTTACAEFVVALLDQAPPDAAFATARAALIDVTGVMIAARNEPVVQTLIQATAQERGDCSLLLDPSLRRSAGAAALVNGTAAHALDYDDVQFNAHPSAVLVPALLAASEQRADVAPDLLRAYLAGYEVWGELHRREPLAYHDKGWHPTAALGTAAATAAVACLRGMDVRTTATALSLAGSFTGGVVANFGSMAKSVHAGRAAASAVAACDLAAAGITAGADGIGGLLAALSPQGGVDLLSEPVLGRHWFSVATPPVFKKYPICFAAHRPLDALLELIASTGIHAHDVQAVTVEIRPTQARLLRFQSPGTGLEAKFSMPFAVACALLRRRVALTDLDDGFVTSTEVQDLMTRVHLIERHSDRGRAATADRLQVTLRDGRVLDSGEITATRPLLHLTDKFLNCCHAGGHADAERLLRTLEALSQRQDLRRLATDPSHHQEITA